MSTHTLDDSSDLKLSKLADNIIGSEIIKLTNEVNAKIKNGEKIFNLTIGDYNPKEFPIPKELKQAIIDAYTNDQTNYPMADGMPELRQAVSKLLKERGALSYQPEEIVISGGARPLIYSIFRALVDPGDSVIFPVPSWNNHHYTQLNGAKGLMIETTAANNFMPTAEDFKPLISSASVIVLCSPLNPTGTTFKKGDLEDICDVILEENEKRVAIGVKPVYLIFDQIYWALTLNETKHFSPVVLRPKMKSYTLLVDGISKSLAATGVRVGWSAGPKKIIDKMKAILTHVGAWAPRAEQLATAVFLDNLPAYDNYLSEIKVKISGRLQGFYEGFLSLKEEGLSVDAIAPEAAIYLTVQLDLLGKRTADGSELKAIKDITKYILDEGGVALIPLSFFGASVNSNWYRLSVGTCKQEDVKVIIENLRKALKKLK